MNKLIEFRRLRWIAVIQSRLYNYRKKMLAIKLLQLNHDETAIEYVNSELMRLARLEQPLLELSYTYDFNEDFNDNDVDNYLLNYIGIQDLLE